MDTAKSQQTIGQLRQLANDIGTNSRSRKEVASDLFDRACDLAISLSDRKGQEELQERARRFSLLIQSDIFQQMCDLAQHLVLFNWRETKTHEYSLWTGAQDFILSPDKAEDGVLLLARLTREQHPGVGSAESDPQMPTLDDVKVDLRNFGKLQYGPAVGHRLATFVKELKRLSQWLGKPRQLQRAIMYFDDVLASANRQHQWGSFWIYGCLGTQTSPDAFHNTKLYSEWLELDPQGIAKAMADAGEDLLLTGNVIANQTGDDEILEAEKDPVSAATEQRETKRSADQESNGEVTQSQGGYDESSRRSPEQPPPPREYYSDSLRGQSSQIAWALGEVRIISGFTDKFLKAKLKSGFLWKKVASKGDYFVYVSRDIREELLSEAIKALEQIKARGPYRHDKHTLPARYRKYGNRPLRSHSEATLAQVLHEAGLLKDEKVLTLHGAIAARGTFFGKFADGEFSIFLSEQNSLKQLSKAHEILKTKQEAR